MLRNVSAVAMLLALLATTQLSSAASINFDDLTDSTLVSTQYAAMSATFSNALVLGAGISLNEFEFPPRSGANVVSDNGGPIAIDFSSPIISFQGFFTYTIPLTLRAFGVGSALLGTAQSSALCTANLALSGDSGCSPNELLTLSGIGGIVQITVTGNAGGSSFVADDFDFEPATTSDIPEPGTLWSVPVGLTALAFACRGFDRYKK